MKNKTHILLLALALLTGPSAAWSQTADSLVAQGRTALAAHDMPTATLRFSEAVQADTNHQLANFFYGLTRLLNSASTAAGDTFLDQLGISQAGRNIYDWNTTVAEDGNGDPVAPSGMAASAFAGHLRTHILPEIVAAEANLAKVTSTSFLVSLSADETGGSAVDIDYPDVQMIRALLKALKYWIYTVNSWNANVQLSALKDLAVNHLLNAEDLLASYPQLFTFATTSDLTAAKTAFQEFETFYQSASLAIRNRASQEGILFEYDPEMADREENFRQTLTELKNTLTTPGTLTLTPNLTFNLANHFSINGAPRAYLPSFVGDSFIRGTLPDTTFGGIVTGLKRSDIDDFLGDITKSRPNILQVSYQGTPSTGLTLVFVSDISYNEGFNLLTSTTLPFTSATTVPPENTFISQGPDGSRQFETVYTTAPGTPASYFVVKTFDTFVIEGYVYDSFGFPISGAFVQVKGDDSANGFTSLDGYFSITPAKEARLPYTLYRLQVFHEQLGTMTTDYHFRNELLDLKYDPPAVTPTPPANDNFTSATAVVGFPVTTTGNNVGATREPGEPQHTDLADPYAGRQSVWWNWIAPTSGPVEINTVGSTFDTLLGVYTGSSLGSLTLIGANDGYPEDDYQASKVFFTATAGTTYRIAVDGWRLSNGDITLNIKAQ